MPINSANITDLLPRRQPGQALSEATLYTANVDPGSVFMAAEQNSARVATQRIILSLAS